LSNAKTLNVNCEVALSPASGARMVRMALDDERSASVKNLMTWVLVLRFSNTVTFWPVAPTPPFSAVNTTKSSTPSRLVSR
jgi:hypothetical protein